MAKNLPCNSGDMGSIPGQGTKIPRSESNWAHTATAGAYVLQQKTPLDAMKTSWATTKAWRSQINKMFLV